MELSTMLCYRNNSVLLMLVMTLCLWCTGIMQVRAHVHLSNTSLVEATPQSVQLLAATISTEAEKLSQTKSSGRVLFILSSSRFHGNSSLPANVSFGEVVNAWDIFVAAGYAVDFVSPAGGAVPIDPTELGPRLTARLQDRRIMDGLERTAKPEQIDSNLYQAVYYVGGSNAIYQVVDDENLQHISRQVYERGGVVSAVCHGTAGIARLKLSDGKYLVSGKRVTGYPEEYEDRSAAYFQHFPFLIRQTIEQHGGVFNAPDPEKPHMEIDGRLVTGQNYPSAPLVANAVVKLLQKKSTQ
jgi:putative intracellular protease/amidase